MSTEHSSTNPLLLGVLTGIAAAVAFAVVVVGGGAFVYLKYQAASVRRCWNLVPVVVAATDLQAGAGLTIDQLSQRSIPEQFVTSSNVKPDSASFVINQVLIMPISAGEPLRWNAFEAPTAKRWDCSEDELKACASLAPPNREKLNRDLRLRLRGTR